jgi:hypothetical protein
MNSEQSVRQVFEHAFSIAMPDLNQISSNESVWPVKYGFTILEPFLMSYCGAVCQLLNLTNQINPLVISIDEKSFCVKYDEVEHLDSGAFLLVALEGVKQLIDASIVSKNNLDVSLLMNAFTPKNFGLEKGEILDLKKIQQGLVSAALKEAGVLSVAASRNMTKYIIDDIDSIPAPSAGMAL